MIIKYKIFITNLFFIFLAIVLNDGLLAQTYSEKPLKQNTSFCIKTDVSKWAYLNPNIGTELKFNRRLAIDFYTIYLPSGISWPVSLFSKKTELFFEKKPLKGFELESNFKYFFGSKQYLAIQFFYNNLKYNNQHFNSEKTISMFNNEYGFGLVYGLENNNNKVIFNELHIGFRWKYSFINRIQHENLYQNIPEKKSSFTENSPEIIINWSLGKRFLRNNTDSTKYREMPRNSIYFEVLGSGYFESFNYESTIYHNSIFYLTQREGISIFPSSNGFVSFPFLLNGNLQLNDYFYFEIGAGARFALNDLFSSDLIGSTGFRYVGRSGFLLRINWTPQIYPLIAGGIGFGKGNNFEPWFGLSIGYSFGKKGE